MLKESPTPEQVAASFQKLETSAAKLNKVSDQLGESIAALDAALKRLNLGVPAWTKIAGAFDPNDSSYWSHDLGYAKVGGKWGVALRTVHGDAGDPESERVERWLFNDAPRAMRLAAIDYIPALFDELVKAAEVIAEQTQDKIGSVQRVVSAVTAHATARR